MRGLFSYLLVAVASNDKTRNVCIKGLKQASRYLDKTIRDSFSKTKLGKGLTKILQEKKNAEHTDANASKDSGRSTGQRDGSDKNKAAGKD